MGDIPTIYTRHNFATVFILPESEVIEYLVLGDRDHWSYNRERPNIFDVVPLKPLGVKGKKKAPVWDGTTNVQAITKSGNQYVFHLQLVEGKFDAAIKVIDPEEEPKKIASECDTGLKAQLTAVTLREAEQSKKIDQLSTDLQSKVDPAEFLASANDDYEIPRKLKHDPFKVTRIYSRKGYTYIRSKARNQPAFFEKDGKEKRHVNYSYLDGVYVIPGEVLEGCLKISKHEGCFKKKG